MNTSLSTVTLPLLFGLLGRQQKSAKKETAASKTPLQRQIRKQGELHETG
jgi:hypothetical protein